MADVSTLSIVVRLENLESSLRGLSQLSSGGHDAEKSLLNLEHGAEQLRHTLEALGVALGAIELLKLANEAREAFENFERLGAVVAQVGAVHGVAAEEIIKTEAALRAQGASMQDARDDALLLINAHIDLANAGKLLGVAQDIAAITGKSEAEAMHSVVIAIQTGMDRSLKHAGITLDLAKAVDHVAASMGGSAGQMSQAQKEQVRLNAVLQAGTQIAGAHAAALDTDGGAALEAQKQLSTLKTIVGSVFANVTEGAPKAFLKTLIDINEWAKKNPEELVKIADAIKSIAVAIGAAVAAFLLLKAVALAASAAVAIFGAVETITAFIELARAVETAADAMALLELATEAINPGAVIVSIAAIAAGLIAWHKLTKDTTEATEKLQESLNGLHPAITKVAAATTPLDEGLSSSADALRRLALMKESIGPLISGLMSIGGAYIFAGKGAGQLAENSAALQEAVIKETVGLVGQDKAEMVALVTRKHAAEVYVQQAKTLRDVTDAGEDSVRVSEQQASSAGLVGQAAREAAIEFEHQNAVIKAQRDLFGAAQVAAISYADQSRDAQIKASRAINEAQAMKRIAADLGDIMAGAFDKSTNSIENMVRALAKLAETLYSFKSGFGKVAAGAAGASAGFGVGQSIGSSDGGVGYGSIVKGGLAGGASGALAGTAILPGIGTAIGTVVGELAGVAGALIGGMKAAKERKDSEDQLRVSLTLSVNAMRVLAGVASPLSQSLLENAAAFKKLRDDNDAAFAGTKNQAQRESQLAEINGLEAIRIQQLKDEAAALHGSFMNDLEVRNLRAHGMSAEADAMADTIARGKELSDAIKQFGASSEEVAKLMAVQAMEMNNAAFAAFSGKNQSAFAANLQAMNDQIAADNQARAEQKQLLQDQLDVANEQLDVVTKSLTLQQKAVDSLRATVDALHKQTDSLRLSNLSPLSANDRYLEAARQYNLLATEVAAGDQSKISEFTAAQTAWLTESRAMFGSSGRYEQDFKQAEIFNATLTDHFQTQLSTEEQILSVLQHQSDQLNAQIALLAASIQQSAYDAALSRQTYAVGSAKDPNYLVQNGVAGATTGLPPWDPMSPTGRALAAAMGGGGGSAPHDTSMSAYSAWIAKVNGDSGRSADWGTPYDQWLAQGSPSFARGGTFRGGVMQVHPGELIQTGPARVTNSEQLNAPTVARLEVMIAQLGQLLGATRENTSAVKKNKPSELAGSRR